MGMMLLAAALYALHLPINQRVLMDMPAPTVTLYTLFAMSAIVVPAFLIIGPIHLPTTTATIWPVVGLTLVTFFSRITLFLGVKHIGGMQTALLGLFELLVSVGLAQIWLHETMTLTQWAGAALLSVVLVLAAFDKTRPPAPPSGKGWLSWIRPRL